MQQKAANSAAIAQESYFKQETGNGLLAAAQSRSRLSFIVPDSQSL
ncbi:MAG: hypothetical protein F6K03_14880 [Kamptonema sp. SIO4C4]|nr:hypothetical protein [Kamptonema sp. SIO4C4]